MLVYKECLRFFKKNLTKINESLKWNNQLKKFQVTLELPNITDLYLYLTSNTKNKRIINRKLKLFGINNIKILTCSKIVSFELDWRFIKYEKLFVKVVNYYAKHS